MDFVCLPILSQIFVVTDRRPSLSVLSVLIAPVSLLFLLFVLELSCYRPTSEGDACDAIVGDLVISEIMQNPNTVSDENGEWFELYNNSTLWNQIRQNLIKKRGQNSWDKASKFFLETILKN